MNETQIWNALVELSKARGMYGRLCRQLEADAELKQQYLHELAEKKPKDVVELIMIIED